MLVNNARRLRSRDDDGSALVSVLVIMLVLSIGALSLAAIVTNTSGVVADSRSKAQSRAAADAGLADVVAGLKRGDLSCPAAGVTLSDSDIAVDGAGSPAYDYAVTCGAGFATITAYSEVDGARTGVQAVYSYSEAPEGVGDMVFFGTGNVTFTHEVDTAATGRLLNIVVPQASFTCQNHIPANITARGDISANGGCTIDGAATSAAGVLDMCCGTDTIKGNVATGGTGTSTVRGTLGGSLHANGRITFGWEGKTVAGSVTANGNVSLGNVRIQGTLTMPTASTLNMQSGVVSGGVVRTATVAGPVAPTLPSWFEYKFAAADWPGFTVVTLAASGSGPGTCGYFNSSPGTGWASLASYATPTIIDARNCGTFSSNNGSNPNLAIKTNIVLLAKGFDLTTLQIRGATGLSAKPKLWVMTEDPTPGDSKPTCGSGYGALKINGTVIATSVKAIAYSPCKIDVAGGAGGIDDQWNGTFYGGGWNYGGGLTFTADPIGVPGMGIDESTGGGAAGLGTLISQRDVAWEDVG